MRMARELTITPNYDPIDPGVLQVYPIDNELDEEEPRTFIREIVVPDVSSPLQGDGTVRNFKVRVEFEAEGLALDEASFYKYVKTYKGEAKITQETMATFIAAHLHEALGLQEGEVFVEVSRTNIPKKVHVGGVPQ